MMTSASHTHHTQGHSGIEDALARLSKLGGQARAREHDGEVGLSRTMGVLAAFVIIGMLAWVVLVR